MHGYFNIPPGEQGFPGKSVCYKRALARPSPRGSFPQWESGTLSFTETQASHMKHRQHGKFYGYFALAYHSAPCESFSTEALGDHFASFHTPSTWKKPNKIRLFQVIVLN